VLEQCPLPGYIFTRIFSHECACPCTRTRTRTRTPREHAHHANMHSSWATNAHTQRTARTGKLELGRATSQETWTQALARQPTQLRMNQPIQTSADHTHQQENFGYMSNHNRRVTAHTRERALCCRSWVILVSISRAAVQCTRPVIGPGERTSAPGRCARTSS
jgi:hypothetical protein